MFTFWAPIADPSYPGTCHPWKQPLSRAQPTFFWMAPLVWDDSQASCLHRDWQIPPFPLLIPAHIPNTHIEVMHADSPLAVSKLSLAEMLVERSWGQCNLSVLDVPLFHTLTPWRENTSINEGSYVWEGRKAGWLRLTYFAHPNMP